MPENAYSEHAVIVDTNVLLELPEIEKVDWGLNPIQVLIVESVVDNELRGLSNHHAPDTARAARRAFQHLTELQRRMPREGYPLPGGGRLQIVPVPDQVPSPLQQNDVDHQQIALAQAWRAGSPGRFSALVTRDQRMADIARLMRPPIPVVRPPFHQMEREIRTRLQWLRSWSHQLEEKPQAINEPQAEKPAPANRHPRFDPQSRLRQRVRNLYGRVRSAHHRAILAIAPLEMRLAFSAHLLDKLTTEKNRAVFLFVPEQHAVAWWAAELRRRIALPPDAVCVFGEDPAPRVGHTRVIIYRHEQIERRLDHHVARFSQAGFSITALVDGCELIDPVAIAMLLFDCDQFVGFTQHPFDHIQATGGRMLEAFFRQQTVATYTFADADQDGWLHPFDVIRRPVRLADYEQEEYDTVQRQFLALHNRIRHDYPEVEKADDFWSSLHRMLNRHVDEEAAMLFALREKLENISQDAREKLEVVERLLDQSKRPARCLFLDCDHEQWWTKTLGKRLPELGYEVAVVDRGVTFSEWDAQWRLFERAKVDCLIMPEVPPHGLVRAPIHRLILPTPLAPLSLLSRMTDWTLSHTISSPPLSVDLLYTLDTPDQEAMLAFAAACFGLRFN